MSESATQNAQLLTLLRQAGPFGVTSLEALRAVGTLRLASRVYDLRAAGYDVRTEMVTLEGGKRVARYTLHEKGSYEQMGLPL